MDGRVLVGAWSLVSWQNRTGDGTITYPFGAEAIGSLLYTDDGHMSAFLMTRGRPNWAIADQRRGTAEEHKESAESCIAYAGEYELDGDAVLHHVRMSLFPNWIGTTQRRIVTFAEGRLKISTPPIHYGGQEQTAWLMWTRAGHGARWSRT